MRQEVIDGLWFLLYSFLVFGLLMAICLCWLLVCLALEAYASEKLQFRIMCEHDRLLLVRKKDVKPYKCDRCGMRF